MNLSAERQSAASRLTLFMKGDEAAYAYFYRLFVSDLFAYGKSLGGDEETLKDIVQEIFIYIFSARVYFASTRHLKCYLLQSVKNRLYDLYKSSAYRRGRPLEEASGFALQVDVLDEMLDREQQTLLKKKIEKLLSVLTDRQREVLFLRYTQELDYGEIARILRMTEPAARKLLSRAVKRLREEYGLLYILILCLIKF